MLACSPVSAGAVGATCRHRGPCWLNVCVVLAGCVVNVAFPVPQVLFLCKSSISGEKVEFAHMALLGMGLEVGLYMVSTVRYM